MPKPVAKIHPVRLAILGGLIDAPTATRNHKVWDAQANDVVTSKVSLPAAPRFPLAGNVSAENVERLARRWSR
jgi:hypothetical protein